jgi:flagellar basal-body rod protein FlgC
MADPTSSTSASDVMAVAASALRAQQSRMRIIAENMANADSTSKTPGGDPYRRQIPVFTPKMTPGGMPGVAMSSVAVDPTPFQMRYEPGHPSADAKGYVKLPNVDPLVEALDLKDAQRAYSANISVIETQRAMDSSTMTLLKQ